MRSALSFLITVALLVPIPASAATPLPAWLAGTWMREDGAAWAEEVWTPPRNGQMLGIARDGFGPDIGEWSFVRIERARDGAPELVLQEKGGAAIHYPLAVASEAAIEFTNPGRSSAQRIRYSRQGQLLVVETSRMDGSEARQWNYRPVVPPVD